MGILFAGGELEDVAVTGAVIHGSTSTRYRTTYARTYLQVPGTATFAAMYARASFTAGSTLGITARVHALTGLAANSLFFWLATGGAARLRLKLNSTSPSTVTLESYNGSSATTLQTSTATVAADVLYRMDVLVNFAASGSVKVWIDGTLIIDYSGNTAAGGGTTLDSANFGPMAAGASTAWSEIIVTDGEDPRPLTLKTLVPNATGDVTDWTSGAFGDIDETTASDTDLAVSDTANQILAVNATGMPSGASGLSVRAVKSIAMAARGAAGPSKLALGVRQSATNGFAAAQTLDTGYGAISTTWTTNPVTGAAFTSVEIEALQLAYRSET